MGVCASDTEPSAITCSEARPEARATDTTRPDPTTSPLHDFSATRGTEVKGRLRTSVRELMDVLRVTRDATGRKTLAKQLI
jgi:hypothetical protein